VERTCEQNAAVIRQGAKFIFGQLLHSYIGDLSITLRGAGANDTDLQLQVTDEWLATNLVANLGVKPEEIKDIWSHVSVCENQCCVEARRRYYLVKPMALAKLIPHGEAILLLQHVTGGMANVVFERDGVPADMFNAYQDIGRWFGENEFTGSGQPHN